MNIKFLMITFNRPTYTEKSLSLLCDTAPTNLRVTIWDNGSNAETKEVVKSFEKHWCVERVIFNEKNDKLRHTPNWFWKNNQSYFIPTQIRKNLVLRANLVRSYLQVDLTH